MTPALLTYRGAVYPWHCDHMNHMNVMWYVGKFDEATWHLFAALGLTPQWLRTHDRGMAAVEQQLRYARELHAGDLVTVESRVLALAPKSIRFAHEMRDDGSGEVAATCELTAGHLDVGARRAAALPDFVAVKGAALAPPPA